MSWSIIREVVREALYGLYHHRFRAALSMLGISWGIISVVVLLAYGEGFRVALDAGFKGAYADGTVIQEKDLNLRVMLRVRDLLQQAGFQVIPSRTRDAPVNADGKDLTGDGRVTVSDDLQARVDLANANGSDLFVSIHFNGVSDPNTKGTYIFYDPDRPFADKSKALAELVDQAIGKALKDAGYTTVDHGATKDTAVLGGEVGVRTLGGASLRLKVPPTTQNAQVLRLRGHGMPAIGKSGEAGDLYATVDVQLPKVLTPEQRQHFEDLQKLDGMTPDARSGA